MGNASKSRFNSTVPLLAELTGLPLFIHMRDEGRAFPMALKIDKEVASHAPEGQRRNVRRALARLALSQRYLRALAAPDAVRLDLDGNPAGLVHESARVWAQRLLDQRMPRKRLVEMTERALDRPHLQS